MDINIKGIDQISLSIMITVFIVCFTICFLAIEHYNSSVVIEKEKIEVSSNQNSNLIQ